MDGSFYSDQDVWTESNCQSAEYLFSSHYDDLLDLARRIRRRRSVADTYMTGDLLHDAFLKLNDDYHWNEKDHFLASMALALRHTLVSHARKKLTSKRGGNEKMVSLDDVDPADTDQTAQYDRVLDIDASLSELAKEAPRLVQVVDCRFFAGYTEEETATLLGVTSRTVRRDWEKARLFFRMRLSSNAV